MTETKALRGFSRRSFIKGVAAVTAAGALAGCTPKEDDKQQVDPVVVPEEQIFLGSCAGNCAGGCFVKVHVRDGQIVRTSAADFPDTQYNRICSKGVTSVGRIYGSKRLLYPMRRIAGSERGTNEFERISWDEAIDEIASKWTAYQAEFGNEAVSVLSGSGNYHVASGVADGVGGNAALLRNVLGASRIAFDVDAAAFIGWMRSIGGRCSNEAKDMVNSKTIVCWASNPSVSQLHVMHFIMEAKERGAKYIVIDPVYNANAAKADWFIPINPSTDGALAMGMLNYMFENDLLDEEILKNKSTCPFLVKEDGTFLRLSEVTGVAPEEGAVDPYTVWDLDTSSVVAYTESTNPALKEVAPINGVSVKTAMEMAITRTSEYPLDRTAEITGVPEKDIIELCRVYLEDGPVRTHSMMGCDHYFNGHYNTWSMCLVTALTGNIGIEGGNFGIPQVTSAHLMNAAAFSPTDAAGNPCRGAGRSVITKEAENVLDSGMYMGEPLVIKSVYVTCTNPMCTFANHDKMVDAFKKIEYVVVADVAMTETCLYADLILPAAYWYEQDDIMAAYGTHPYIALTEKAIEPLGESKPDYEIQKLICEAMGLVGFYKPIEEFLSAAYDTDLAKELGCNYEALLKTKSAKMWAEDNIVMNNTGTVPTETGRYVMYYEAPFLKMYEIGQEYDPSKESQLYWEPARYADKNSPERAKYPYHMLSDHMRTRTHSQWFDCDYVKEYEPEPVLRINPEDAAELGISEGDAVKAHNDFGFVVMKANINAGLPRGIVSSPRSFQVEEFIDGHFGSLTSLEYNQTAANMNYNDVCVALEKM